MVQGKLLEYAEDLKRFCVNHKWAKFFRDYEDGDEGLAKYEDFYKNSYDDYKEAARDLCYEIIEYFDLLWNQLPDKDLYLEDEKQNPRSWLDGVSKTLQTTVSDMKEGPELFGFLLKGSQMLAWIKEAAIKTDEQFYGGRRTDTMPYYLGESTEKTFQNILNENNGHGFLAASMLGLAGIGTMAAIDGNRIAKQADELGIKISAEDTGGHEAGGLIDPIYKFKYEGLSDEYGNDIDGLCKYIKRHNRADNVTYTDEGDHYKIHATYKYTTHINRCSYTRTAECDLDLPKDYFGVSFIFNESIEQVFAQILKENKKLKEASFTIGEFCHYKGIENPEAFRDFLRKLWDFNHVELWTQSDSDSLERALDKYQALREASVFKPSGFGLSGHYGYEAPEKEPVYVATETNEDDGELYFDETGCTTEFIENAKKFVSEEQALEFAKDNVIFGTPGAKLRESDDTYKAKVQDKWLKGNSLVKDKKDADTFESKTEPTQRINQMKKDGKIDKNAKITVLTESIDPTGAAFNLTKLKGYLRFETKWEYDEDYPEDAMLVDKVHEPPRFTVNWIGPEGKKHPNTYCVNIRKDRGESWTWITHFCLKASDAAEMVNLEVKTWEHNNESWRFN